MGEGIRNIRLPLDEATARSLELGDIVTVTGKVFTGRSRFHIRAVQDDLCPPLDYSQINCFFHVGPVVRRTGDAWEIVSIEPTSSIRFERYGADVVRKLGLRTLIGKTTMGPRTADALRELGGVYLSKIGLCGNVLQSQVRRVEAVYFLEELGKTEATWVLDVDAFGPFFVAIDAHGNSYFETLAHEVDARLSDIEGGIGIPPGYAYTDVNPQGRP